MVDYDHCVINKIISQYKQRTNQRTNKNKANRRERYKVLSKSTNIEEGRKEKTETNFKT